MAGMRFVAIITPETLAAAATETLLQVVAATNHAVKVLAWGVSFQGGEPADDMIRCELLRQTTAGTSSSLTLVKWDDSAGDTLDASALQDFSGEPTAGDILAVEHAHSQAGFAIWYPDGKEPVIGAGDRMGIRVITPTGVNPNAVAQMVCEE